MEDVPPGRAGRGDGAPGTGATGVTGVTGVLALLTAAALLVVLVEVPTSPRPWPTAVLALALAAAATAGYRLVADRSRGWAVALVVVELGLGLALAAAGRPTLGATLLLVVVVVEAVLLLPLPAAALVVAVVPLVHVGMSWQDGWRDVLGTLVTAVFAAVVTRLVVREQQARAELERSAAELRRLGAEVAGLAAAAERARVARDIHDGLGHHLTVVQVQVRAARAVLAHDPARADELLASAEEQAGGALAEVRRSVGALRGPLLDVPLEEAVRDLVRRSSAAGPPTAVSVRGPVRAVPPAVAEVLFRSAQEGLTNVRRHAPAARADLVLDYADPGSVRLRVADDGPGSGAPGVPAHPGTDAGSTALPRADGSGTGLRGLEERLRAHGGTLRLSRGDDGGTVLDVTVPG